MVIATNTTYAQNNPSELVQKGIDYERTGMIDAALELYEKAITLDPNHNNALFNAAIIYLRNKNQDQKAADYLERVVILNPQDGEAYYNLAIAYFKLQQYSKAIEYNDKSLKLNYAGTEQFRSWLEPYRYKEIDFEYMPLLAPQQGKVYIKIKGNPPEDKILIRDTIKNLEAFENVPQKGMFTSIIVEFIRWEDEGNTHHEKWIVAGNDNKQTPYMIQYTTSPQGGTDILIKEIKDAEHRVLIEIRK